MQFAIATVSLGGSLIGRLEAAAGAGFSGIEFFWDDLAASGLPVAQVASVLADLNLTAVSLQPIRGFEGDALAAVEAGHAGARAFFEAASALGAPVVGICANEKPSAGGPELAAEMLMRLAETADEYGLQLGFEGLAWSRRLHRIADVWQAVALTDAPNLGIVIDSFHCGMVGDTVADISMIDPARITLLQVSDAARMPGMAAKEISRHHRRFPGDGELAVRALVDAVRAKGYDGVITVELFNDVYRAMPPQDVAHRAMASVITGLGLAGDRAG